MQTTTEQKFYPVADTFVSVARHGSRWGCYMQDEETGEYAWIGEWLTTKGGAVEYAQRNYPLPAKLVADALFARQAARDARKAQEDYYTAPGFNHARYAELVDAKKLADSEWNRAMDRVDANSEATDLYQEAVNPPPAPAPTPGAPLAAPTVTICANRVPVLSVDRAQFEDTARAVRQQPATCQRCYFVAPQHAHGCVNTDKPRCPDCGHYWCSGCANLWPDPEPTPALPAYNPEDGAPCAQCGHGQELHYEGVGECWEHSDTVPRVGCPCPQFQAREAAQRADEAAWLPMAGGSGDDYVSYRTDIDWRHWFTRAQRAVALAHLEDTAAAYRAKHGSLPAEPRCIACGHEKHDHEVTAGSTECWYWLDSDVSCACPHYSPPMAGGAPSHYTDPAWLADEAWALQAERNAESTVIDEGCIDCEDGGRESPEGVRRRCSNCPLTATWPPEDRAAGLHTHPCPTCRALRPCTGTGCADGPRECNTCSNCRGW